jgi:hypothetical protein
VAWGSNYLPKEIPRAVAQCASQPHCERTRHIIPSIDANCFGEIRTSYDPGSWFSSDLYKYFLNYGVLQTNSCCEGGELGAAEVLRGALTHASEEICKNFLPLCAEYAGGGPITQEVLSRAEASVAQRFKHLAGLAHNTVCSPL